MSGDSKSDAYPRRGNERLRKPGLRPGRRNIQGQPRFASQIPFERTIQEAAVNIGLWHKPVTVRADGPPTC